MITVHHLENSRSQRILWLLEELGLPYEIKRYARDPDTMLAPASLKKIHPLGKSPIVTDDDITLAESGAIIEYLLDTYDAEGQWRPAAGSAQRRQFTYWLHYAEGSAMPPLLLSLIFSRMPKAPMPGLLRPLVRAIAKRIQAGFVTPQRRLHLGYMDEHLARQPWFAGEAISAADIQMSFPLEAAASRDDDLTARYPHLATVLTRMHARPAYQRALDRGGPYAMVD
ncbi:glutathione S-transferase [Oleiagrimonas sp. C23AA]|uniref:glutathione S-transferase family protein n=1 Tax=Oleiagrimonas sp. C23AA TaxID=2719047 RepID=UPI00141F7A1E|nr:glutathione S-transferase [Oleiagrimonas sp. C23AA]NII11945.1 glutathione S-transferase [Oleiagrimonas sp. C23AA]